MAEDTVPEILESIGQAPSEGRLERFDPPVTKMDIDRGIPIRDMRLTRGAINDFERTRVSSREIEVVRRLINDLRDRVERLEARLSLPPLNQSSLGSVVQKAFDASWRQRGREYDSARYGGWSRFDV